MQAAEAALACHKRLPESVSNCTCHGGVSSDDIHRPQPDAEGICAISTPLSTGRDQQQLGPDLPDLLSLDLEAPDPSHCVLEMDPNDSGVE